MNTASLYLTSWEKTGHFSPGKLMINITCYSGQELETHLLHLHNILPTGRSGIHCSTGGKTPGIANGQVWVRRRLKLRKVGYSFTTALMKSSYIGLALCFWICEIRRKYCTVRTNRSLSRKKTSKKWDLSRM